MDFKNKKVLVCGMALSGIHSAILLKKLGARVILQDKKNTKDIKDQAKQLEEMEIELILGKNPDDIILEQDMIVLSPGIPLTLPFIQKARQEGIYIIGEFELASRLCKCPIAAITGTNGKTTTTTLLGNIMELYIKKTAIVGNIGIPFTQKVMDLDKNSFCVAEVSSFQLETIDEFHPHISAVLNITPDHLDRHKTFENYIATKELIFSNQTENDYIILNYDNKYCYDMRKRTKAKPIFFSTKVELKEGIFLRGNHIHVRFNNMNFTLININELKIIGYHNIENVMAASAMALCAGVPKFIICTALKDFTSIPHRMEYVETINNIIFYNDSKATNPEAAIKSLESISRPIILIGGGYNKDSTFDQWVKAFKNRVKGLVVIGAAKEDIINTCNKYNYNNVIKAETFFDAMHIAYKNAQPGDCVLLSPACASWDMFRSYEERGNIFKDFVFKIGGE